MEGVHSALEQLVSRLTQLDGDRRGETALAAAPPRTPRSLRDSLRETTAATPERPVRRPSTAPGECPLRRGEPGRRDDRARRAAPAPRRGRGRPGPEMPAGDIKASFIAARPPRRQAAAAEAAGTAALPSAAADRADEPRGSLVERLRATIERRRRPLLLGLAAIVLALGTLQALQGSGARMGVPAVTHAATAPADPATTQAVAALPVQKSVPPASAPAEEGGRSEAAKPEATKEATKPEASLPKAPEAAGARAPDAGKATLHPSPRCPG